LAGVGGALAPAAHDSAQREVVHESGEVLSDVVITRLRFIPTHGGVIFGLSPTGKAVDVPTLDIFFFRDGKVAATGT
jgi:predicted ester cyclase